MPNIYPEDINIVSLIESKSWICNFLHEKGLISQNDFTILSRFGAWVLENHPLAMQVYWSYIKKLIAKFENEENIFNIKKIFNPWIENTLRFIKSSQLNRAYHSFCEIVIELTEKYNKDYQLFTKDELNFYLSMKKTIQNKILC